MYPFNCCFGGLKRGLPRKFTYVLYCHIKLAFLLTVYVFGSCFRMLPVVCVCFVVVVFFNISAVVVVIVVVVVVVF